MATGQIIVAEATGTVPAPADAAAGTAVEHPAAEHAVFPPFDSSTFASQLLWLAITFVALYLLLARVVIPRIGGILSDRAGRIAGDIEKAQKAKAQSEAAVAAYEKALAAARSNAGTIAEAARNEAKEAADKERRASEAGLAKKLAAAEQNIAGIKQRALSEVGAIASDTTAAIVKALIDIDAPKGDVDAAVAQSMKTGG
ncbi:MAG TPA: F0F1 ATP synthase subunit B [Bauldia sp.]|nr:F0F1 ATP synthase subunit B [Bauldia sp.]